MSDEETAKFLGKVEGTLDAHTEILGRLERGQERLFQVLDAREATCHATHLDLEKRMPRNGNGKSSRWKAPVTLTLGAGGILAVFEGIKYLLSIVQKSTPPGP